MRILVPVVGSDSANRAAAHAVALVKGRADAEIILLNVQNQRTRSALPINLKQRLLRRLSSVALHRLSSTHARRSVSSQMVLSLVRFQQK